MSSAELTEWMAFDAIEPFGDMRADYRNGILAALVANALGGEQAAYTAIDFMPTLTEEQRRATSKALKNATPAPAEVNMETFEQIYEATFGKLA